MIIEGQKEIKYAIKVINKLSSENFGKNRLPNIVNEIRIHWKLVQCDNFLRLLAIYEDEYFVYIVLEC